MFFDHIILKKKTLISVTDRQQSCIIGCYLIVKGTKPLPSWMTLSEQWFRTTWY